MSDKTPVSRLQELCAQAKVAPPKYNFQKISTTEFICDVEACDKRAEATGRSKNEAKHTAAADILRKFK